jgi:hypothetical protein
MKEIREHDYNVGPAKRRQTKVYPKLELEQIEI